MDSEIEQQFDGLRTEIRNLARETAGWRTAFVQEAAALRTEIRSGAEETATLRTEIRSGARETVTLKTFLAEETAGLQAALARETAGLRSELRAVAERGEEIKRSLRVLSESLRTDVRTLAEGFILTNERLDRFESRVSEEFGEVKAMMRLSFEELDRRLQSR